MIKRVFAGLLSCMMLGMIPLSDAVARDGRGAVGVQVVNDNGRTLRQFPLRRQGQDTYRAYLEARRGQNYAIRVRNKTSHRIGVVIAVDGRNIISGKKSHLSSNERMYVLGPHETAVYEGWRTARDRVNRFYFTDSGDSYAEAFNDRSAMGVIAVAAYRERIYDARPQYQQRRHASPGMAESKSQPGTGFGESEWSPSVRVDFEPERRPFSRTFLKYEWRKTLCRKGLMDCRKAPPANRFWPESDDEYAPHPPGYEDYPPRQDEQWRRNFNRWMYD